jgi:hypothetical protein
MLGLHHALRLMDERDAKRAELRHARSVMAAQTRAVRQMDAQSRVGSYSRIRIGR